MPRRRAMLCNAMHRLQKQATRRSTVAKNAVPDPRRGQRVPTRCVSQRGYHASFQDATPIEMTRACFPTREPLRAFGMYSLTMLVDMCMCFPTECGSSTIGTLSKSRSIGANPTFSSLSTFYMHVWNEPCSMNTSVEPTGTRMSWMEKHGTTSKHRKAWSDIAIEKDDDGEGSRTMAWLNDTCPKKAKGK